MINRYEWLKAVLRTPLADRCKTLASALAIQFANDETGLINPSVLTLAAHLQWSHDKVKRAIVELTDAGWMATTVGIGRGKRSSYALLSPGNVVAMRPIAAPARPITVERTAAKGTQNDRAIPRGKVRRTEAKSTQNDAPHTRHKQSFEQKARASEPPPHPESRLCVKVERGSWQAEAWGKWLWSHRKPSLAELPALGLGNGYRLPWSTPPSDGDATGERILDQVIEWAMNDKPKGAKHDRAA